MDDDDGAYLGKDAEFLQVLQLGNHQFQVVLHRLSHFVAIVKR
jgi:hypothetical protein